MTANEERAIELANGVERGAIHPDALSDDDWFLLVLAAGVYDGAAGPLVVSRRVLDAAERGIGYFAPTRDAKQRARLTLAA